MNLYGLLLTKGEAPLVAEWCREQLAFYDAVVCLDGTADESVADALARYPSVIRLAERDCDIPHKTDHGLRRIAHQEIARRFGHDGWVMCCHPDEFCYHDPRKITSRAEREGYDGVAWYSPHFYPHPSERADIVARLKHPLAERFQHYHWNFQGTGQPWIEFRLYRLGAGVEWDAHTHGNTEPHGLTNVAPFHPIFRHYKITDLDVNRFEITGNSSHYRDRWQGLTDRTGVAFQVKSADDLFVDHIPRYHRCDHYPGWFAQPWNMGDAYCPETDWSRINGPPVELVIRENSTDKEAVHEIWHDDVYGVRTARLRPRMILDINARLGEFARLAVHAWPDARVLACEPDPEQFPLLQANTRHFPQIRVMQAAVLADDVPQILFRSPSEAGKKPGATSSSADERSTVTVPAISIIQLWKQQAWERVDWLKLSACDTEIALLRALAAADLWQCVGWITGRWPAVQDQEPRWLESLSDFLGPTHIVRSRPPLAGRGGHFTALPRRWAVSD